MGSNLINYNMTKTFKINPDLTCHELAGYKLPEIDRTPRTPIAIEVEMVEVPKPQPENYGYYNSESFDDMPSGWMIEGGDVAYYEALKKWEVDIPATNPDGTVKGRWVYE